MELKLYKDTDQAYLHFHVVSGGLRDYRHTVKIWNRVVKYEQALKPKYLASYISKYASKTPYFKDETAQDTYALLVHKTQMHRFSLNHKECIGYIPDKIDTDFLNIDLLKLEVKSALIRDSYKNGKTRKKRYHDYLEKQQEPIYDQEKQRYYQRNKEGEKEYVDT